MEPWRCRRCSPWRVGSPWWQRLGYIQHLAHSSSTWHCWQAASASGSRVPRSGCPAWAVALLPAWRRDRSQSRSLVHFPHWDQSRCSPPAPALVLGMVWVWRVRSRSANPRSPAALPPVVPPCHRALPAPRRRWSGWQAEGDQISHAGAAHTNVAPGRPSSQSLCKRPSGHLPVVVPHP